MRGYGLFSAVLFAVYVGAIAVACSGRSQQEVLRDYFQSLSVDYSTSMQVDRSIAQARSDLQNASDPQAAKALRDFVARSIPPFEAMVEQSAEARPPAQAQEAHDDLVAALTGIEQGLRDAQRDLVNVDSRREAEEIISTHFVPALLRFDKACSQLRRLARDAGTEEDFSCPNLLPTAIFEASLPMVGPANRLSNG